MAYRWIAGLNLAWVSGFSKGKGEKRRKAWRRSEHGSTISRDTILYFSIFKSIFKFHLPHPPHIPTPLNNDKLHCQKKAILWWSDKKERERIQKEDLNYQFIKLFRLLYKNGLPSPSHKKKYVKKLGVLGALFPRHSLMVCITIHVEQNHWRDNSV